MRISGPAIRNRGLIQIGAALRRARCAPHAAPANGSVFPGETPARTGRLSPPAFQRWESPAPRPQVPVRDDGRHAGSATSSKARLNQTQDRGWFHRRLPRRMVSRMRRPVHGPWPAGGGCRPGPWALVHRTDPPPSACFSTLRTQGLKPQEVKPAEAGGDRGEPGPTTRPDRPGLHPSLRSGRRPVNGPVTSPRSSAVLQPAPRLLRSTEPCPKSE